MRKVAFVIHRLVENKILGPLIDEALKRGWPVEVWLNQRDVSTSTKWYEFPVPEKFPDFGGRRERIHFRIFRDDGEFEALYRASDARFVFSEYAPPSVPPRGQSWVNVISCFYDTQCAVDAEPFSLFEHVFTNTDYWKEEGIEYYRILRQLTPALEERFRKAWHVTGTTQFDQTAYADREAIRKKWGVPEGKRVVTVFAFEMNTTYWSQRIYLEPGLWKRFWHLARLPFSYPRVYSRIGRARILQLTAKGLLDRFKFLRPALTTTSEPETMRAIREFCDRNDCFLLMKARRKHDLLPHQKELPDLLLSEDTEYLPATGAQALAASDLLITFYSTAAAEGAAAGVPVINLRPERDEYFVDGQFQLMYLHGAHEREVANERFYNSRNDGVFNFPGVIRSWEVNDFTAKFGQTRLEEYRVDPASYRRYVEKFLGAEPGKAAPRILDWLAKAPESP